MCMQTPSHLETDDHMFTALAGLWCQGTLLTRSVTLKQVCCPFFIQPLTQAKADSTIRNIAKI